MVIRGALVLVINLLTMLKGLTIKLPNNPTLHDLQKALVDYEDKQKRGPTPPALGVWVVPERKRFSVYTGTVNFIKSILP